MDWVNVADRMPEAAQFVWVHDKAQGVALAYYNDYGPGLFGAEHLHNWQAAESVGDSEGLSVEYYHEITHWMPLAEPEPPVCLTAA